MIIGHHSSAAWHGNECGCANDPECIRAIDLYRLLLDEWRGSRSDQPAPHPK